MEPGLEAVIVADDLTGAADTGVLFTALGSPVYLVPAAELSSQRPWLAGAASIGIDTASRHLPALAAAERIGSAVPVLTDLRPRWIYKKIDSCLRGNPGAEIDVLLDAFGYQAALVAPALPAQGRTTIGGIHRVHGRPLAQTEFARDPRAPVTCSVIAQILGGQSRHRIGHVDLRQFGDFAGAVHRECKRGCRLIVCDAAEPGHLDRVAALLARDRGRFLPVGSAGLADRLVNLLVDHSHLFGERPAPHQTGEATGGQGLERLLMVCGTGSPVTRRQLDVLFDSYPGRRYTLGCEWLLTASDEERCRRANDLSAGWTRGVLALQLEALPSAGTAGQRDVDPGQLATRLAETATQIVRNGHPDAVFLTGGDTAAAFRLASAAEAIALERELLPGLVLGRWLGGLCDGLPVVAKPGAFGTEQTLVALYEAVHYSR